jgi:hypothetical protein
MGIWTQPLSLCPILKQKNYIEKAFFLWEHSSPLSLESDVYEPFVSDRFMSETKLMLSGDAVTQPVKIL